MSLLLKNNTEKLVTAIQLESCAQETDWPAISLNSLRRDYKVNSHGWSRILDFVISKGIISRKVYMIGKIESYKWSINMEERDE
jgi:hypothetical protein